VAGATARDDSDLAVPRGVAPDDDVGFLDADQVGVGTRHAGELLVDQSIGCVDELLHRSSGRSAANRRAVVGPPDAIDYLLYEDVV
jgi:hypothetical protein